MPAPVLLVYLDFKVDGLLSATAWNGGHGSRADVTPGVTVIVSDEQDAFFTTIESVSITGLAYVIRWDQTIAVPALIHRPSHP